MLPRRALTTSERLTTSTPYRRIRSRIRRIGLPKSAIRRRAPIRLSPESAMFTQPRQELLRSREHPTARGSVEKPRRPRAASKSVKLQRPARAAVCSHSPKGHGRLLLMLSRFPTSLLVQASAINPANAVSALSKSLRSAGSSRASLRGSQPFETQDKPAILTFPHVNFYPFAAELLSAASGALKGAVFTRLEIASVLCFQKLTPISNNFAHD